MKSLRDPADSTGKHRAPLTGLETSTSLLPFKRLIKRGNGQTNRKPKCCPGASGELQGEDGVSEKREHEDTENASRRKSGLVTAHEQGYCFRNYYSIKET